MSEAISAIAPMGRLTKKIQRQLTLSTISPPSVGPMIGASITGIAVMPMIRPIRCGPAAFAIIIWPTGRIIPPPMPWSTRKKMSSFVDPARPQSTELAVKMASERM